MSLEANRFFNSENNQNLSSTILQMVKKVVNEYDEEIKEQNTIDKVTLSKFKSLYNNFTFQLYRLTRLFNDFVNDTDKTRDDYLDYNLYTPELAAVIDGIITTWNQVVIFLATTLNYNSLSQTNKSYIDNKFTQLAPSVTKMFNNFINDLDKGFAHVTSKTFPSDSLLNNLSELSFKLSKPDFTLINFKGDIKENKQEEEEPEEEPEEDEDEEDEEDEDDEIGKVMRQYVEENEDEEDEEDEDDGGFGFLFNI